MERGGKRGFLCERAPRGYLIAELEGEQNGARLTASCTVVRFVCVADGVIEAGSGCTGKQCRADWGERGYYGWGAECGLSKI